MEFQGWLLEPYIRDKHVHLWFKTLEGDVILLRDRHHPVFTAEPAEGYSAENVLYLFEEHPEVHSASIVKRHPSLHRDELKRVVEVKAFSASELGEVRSYAERLPEVREVYNTGLIPVQWYLIHRGVAPSNLCRVYENKGRLTGIAVIDDDDCVEPPPFKTLIFQASDTPVIEEINVYDGEQNPVTTFKGEEAEVLRGFQRLLGERDPDILVTSSPVAEARNVIHRAACNGLDFRFGRGGELYHGRVLLGHYAYRDMGVAGLVERARFTFAPMGVAADWAAGKTIDSRQCYEAARQDIMVPRMKGGFGFSSSAWDLVRRDRGGMVFSPKMGLHENVACIDFESMFPNIIARKNVSYETVGPDGVSTEKPGFMGLFTQRFLERRLRFKHLRASYPIDSREWMWCQQRQSSLKLMLVVVYGYSGCYANRFANVRVFQEINRQARIGMVQALNVCLNRGFEVIYGDTDSLFVKSPDASRDDYLRLTAEVSEATGLPMGLDRHFRFLVLLNSSTDPRMVAARRYYGKLMEGSLFYRGIELRRHDTPPLFKEMQRRMMEMLFDAEDADQVLEDQLPRVLELVRRTNRDVRRGRVDPRKLVVSKRLRRDLSEYRSLQPHVVAALLGANEDDKVEFIYMNMERSNPYLRVMPASMLNGGHQRYDRKKYAAMTRRAAWNLLRPFVPNEDSMEGKRLQESRLDTYL
jgi:DNA polymerase elongation subunit (family B)